MRGLAGKAKTVTGHFRRHGAAAGFRLLLGEPLSRLGLLHVCGIYALHDAVRRLHSLPIPAGLDVRALTPQEVRQYVQNREPWFFPAGVQSSLARGDQCFAGFLGGQLVCHGWFATRPLPVLRAQLGFAEDVVWEHRLFTKPQFRGLGINPALKVVAMRHFSNMGRTTLANVVIWTNDASRRMHARLGYARVGTLLRAEVARHGRTVLIGGREIGLNIDPLSVTQAA